jgi:copper resistance protein C
VKYRVIAADGHTVSGTLRFTYAPAPPTTTTAPATTSEPPPVIVPASSGPSARVPVWEWVLTGLAVLVMAGVAVAFHRRTY